MQNQVFRTPGQGTLQTLSLFSFKCWLKKSTVRMHNIPKWINYKKLNHKQTPIFKIPLSLANVLCSKKERPLFSIYFWNNKKLSTKSVQGNVLTAKLSAVLLHYRNYKASQQKRAEQLGVGVGIGPQAYKAFSVLNNFIHQFCRTLIFLQHCTWMDRVSVDCRDVIVFIHLCPLSTFACLNKVIKNPLEKSTTQRFKVVFLELSIKFNVLNK